jgi:hypothetical protein
MEPRNFDCPETEAPCAEGSCTTERCYLRENARVTNIRAAADQEQRIKDARLWEIIDPIVRRKISN